jgi:UDP-N-acetyl-D-mannosaminuronic acid dehydrogenase
MEKIVTSIHDRSSRLAVLGSGYVGLPTAALFADTGFRVVTVDVRHEVVDTVNSGISPVREPGLQGHVECNVVASRLKASSNSQVNFREIEIDAVIVSIQTPL